mmetsp:Transcript_133761/g.245944  ORF Transcript_133761/g.245944 Transcript_133761/m.245944 type:complete len:552 (-) Transcript_133761:10-1665(-)
MHSVILLLAWLCAAAHGRRLQALGTQADSTAFAERQEALANASAKLTGNELEALATLLTFDQEGAAFNPASLGMRSLARNNFHASSPPASVNSHRIGCGLPVMEDLDSFREEHQIEVKGEGDEPYEPMFNYEDTPYDNKILDVMFGLGYEKPTPIQAQSWPIALDGRDIISIARTGSGKTCGFLLPGFHKLMTEWGDEGEGKGGGPGRGRLGRPRYLGRRTPKILVLAPTRELVVQIDEEAQKYTRAARAFATSLYGGASKGPQIKKLQDGVDVIAATPGRCNDLLEMGVLNLNDIKYLVLDEADRMLDMGFEPQIRQIISYLPEERQTLMFSATWPREVRILAKDFLVNAVQVNVGDQSVLNANKAITQHVKVLRPFEKQDELFNLLTELNPDEDNSPQKMPKTLIFMSRKADCDHMADMIYDHGHRVETLHGDMSQKARDVAMDRFRTGRTKLLVATDVAARGLDVTDIEAVINYDMPVGSNGVENYVHRIGRTGRANREGKAYTFFTRSDEKCAGELIGVLERAGQDIPSELQAMARFGGGGGGGGGM